MLRNFLILSFDAVDEVAKRLKLLSEQKNHRMKKKTDKADNKGK